jgi:DNA polymerase elongation subunit (family B)
MAKINDETKKAIIYADSNGSTSREIASAFGLGKSTVGDFLRKETYQKWWAEYNGSSTICQADTMSDEDVNRALGIKVPITIATPYTGPKILTLDIETAPIMASVWRLFDQNVGLNMIEQDWYVLSWAAKWMHKTEVIYEDKFDTWDNETDFHLLKGIHALLDEADIIITQNGKKFDAKKLNARFILNGMKPPSSYRHIDTLQEAKKHFGFTSNKLEYMTDKLCKIYKKLKHGKFPGFELWKECLRGNPEAWQEMKDYNIHDVLSLEELYTIMLPWMKTHINMNLYYDDHELRCKCGHKEFEHNGYAYTNLSKFDRFQCTSCGGEVRGRVNLLSAEKRESLRMNIT